jgi:DNA-binding PadR family transcriptional regulator
MSTTRRQMKQLEADGDIERVGVDRTGKPGRPAVLYQLTEQGRQKPKWTAPRLTKAIIEAINAGEFKEVPYMLRLLWMEDRVHAKRFTRSLVRLVPDDVRRTWRKEEGMPV